MREWARYRVFFLLWLELFFYCVCVFFFFKSLPPSAFCPQLWIFHFLSHAFTRFLMYSSLSALSRALETKGKLFRRMNALRARTGKQPENCLGAIGSWPKAMDILQKNTGSKISVIKYTSGQKMVQTFDINYYILCGRSWVSTLLGFTSHQTQETCLSGCQLCCHYPIQSPRPLTKCNSACPTSMWPLVCCHW